MQSQVIQPNIRLLGETVNTKETHTGFQQLPKHYRLAQINTTELYKQLSSDEHSIVMPDQFGDWQEYLISPSKVVAEEVSDLYSIRTFHGRQKSNPAIKIALDISGDFFHAAVYYQDHIQFITPLDYSSKSTRYAIYKKSDLNHIPLACEVRGPLRQASHSREVQLAPNVKRTYRLAIVASGEYSQQFGGSPYNVNNVLNALASGVNLMNPIFLRDIGVEFTLVSTADLIFSNPNTDPFNPNNSNTLSAQTTCDNELGSAGYDVGHLVMWANTGGAASNGACYNPIKGDAFSGSANSVVTLWIDYVAHEIGHQFGMPHNYSASCGGNGVNNFRYEPGEGSSIMCYAGVCGMGYQNFSDHYFHRASIEAGLADIVTYHGGCPTESSTGNSHDPIADAKADLTIPKQTPFILVGDGSDNNDPLGQLTYGWQQYDGNGSITSGSPNCNSTSAPMFRYRDPTSNNYRIFPDFGEVLDGDNNNATWEKLPCIARTMSLSLSVRDNNSNFGRVGHDDMEVTVHNSGPFEVTSPNGGESLESTFTSTWNVNGTNSYCPQVDIHISYDNGTTFELLADAVTNDGSESVTIPAGKMSSNARILISCNVSGDFKSASTFFDVSDGGFSVEGGSLAPCTDQDIGISGPYTIPDNTDRKAETKVEFDGSSGLISLNSGDNATYQGGIAIEVISNFTVQTGAFLELIIEGCELVSSRIE